MVEDEEVADFLPVSLSQIDILTEKGKFECELIGLSDADCCEVNSRIKKKKVMDITHGPRT